MNLTEKKQIVQRLTESLKEAQAVIFSDYQGLSAEKTRELRRNLKKAGGSFTVVKNTLLKRALANTGWSKLGEKSLNLAGPTGLTVCPNDPTAVLKALFAFVKTNTLPQLKAGLYQNLVLGVAQLKELAALPPREVLLGQLLSTLLNPLSRTARTLQNPGQKLVYVLAEIAKKGNRNEPR
jgi:large subunit ribosomal protein L10